MSPRPKKTDASDRRHDGLGLGVVAVLAGALGFASRDDTIALLGKGICLAALAAAIGFVAARLLRRVSLEPRGRD